jgi:hypothetical protein
MIDNRKAAQEAWSAPGWSETAREYDAARPPVKSRAVWPVPQLDLRTDEQMRRTRQKQRQRGRRHGRPLTSRS